MSPENITDRRLRALLRRSNFFRLKLLCLNDRR